MAAIVMPSWIQSVDLVMANSPQNRPWDYKRQLSADEWYIYDNEAYVYDSIGNITWGAIMDSYGWPERVSKLGAGLRQIFDDYRNGTLSPAQLIWRLLNGTSGDDPRDQKAIEEGYDF